MYYSIDFSQYILTSYCWNMYLKCSMWYTVKPDILVYYRKHSVNKKVEKNLYIIWNEIPYNKMKFAYKTKWNEICI